MTQMDIIISSKPFLVMLLWAIIYSMDYYRTIFGAQLYQGGAREYVRFEGSYELNPAFREDIDALRSISPRFIRYLGISIVLIFLVWLLTVEFLGGYIIFPVLVGALFLQEVAVYLRHIRNIALFILMRSDDAIKGRIEYRKWLTLRVSAIELFSFGGFFFLLYLLDKSWFFLGGAIACAVTGVQHFILSTGERKIPPAVE
jgi:hypothetical protein